MIPGVGLTAPFVGKYAAESVGRLFSRLSEHGAASVANTAAATKAFLDVGSTTKAVMFSPTRALAAVRFAPGPEPTEQIPSNNGAGGHERQMAELFKARSAEIRSQTALAPDGSVQLRPEARAAMAARLAPIAAVNPLLADKLETLGARKIAFISSKIPHRPDVGGIQIGPDNWEPSLMQMASWARTINAVENPDQIERHLAAGYLTPEEGEAYRTVYPERFAALHQHLVEMAPTLSKTLPYQRRLRVEHVRRHPYRPQHAAERTRGAAGHVHATATRHDRRRSWDAGAEDQGTVRLVRFASLVGETDSCTAAQRVATAELARASTFLSAARRRGFFSRDAFDRHHRARVRHRRHRAQSRAHARRARRTRHPRRS